MAEENRVVLVVDDEGAICRSLSRLFRNNKFQVITAESGEQAQEIMQSDRGGTIGVIVCDYMMPGMTGAEFLGWVLKKYPDVMRILLTGQADMGAVVASVNTGAIYKMLMKPWDNKELLNVVNESFNHRELIVENKRLNNELSSMNSELKKINANLEAMVEEKAEELIKVTYYDPLTGLANKTLLKDRLHHAIRFAERNSTKIVVVMIGLEHHEAINDSFGLEVGDQVLKGVTERLSACVRASDTVGRYASDVFCIVITDAERTEDPGLLAHRLVEVITNPFEIEGGEVFLGANIGISLYPEDSEGGEKLMANAETAMRQAKMDERNYYRYYSGVFNKIAGARLSLEAELRKAISAKQFVLHYQPKVDIEENRVIGAEALLRWKHPEKGLIPPFEFLPVLEETGLIKAAGRWVIEESCEALYRWRDKGLGSLQLALNLSAKQFHEKNLPGVIKSISKNAGLDLYKDCLELEITESLLMDDAMAARDIMQRLSDMGIKMAIDDFGTGYSSLSYLIKFPLNYLKIDKSFVDEVSFSDDAKAIVEAIVSLSYGLKLKVISEGVENKQQLDALRALGCKQFQGYLFSKPVAEEEFVKILDKDGGKGLLLQDPEDVLLTESLSNFK